MTPKPRLLLALLLSLAAPAFAQQRKSEIGYLFPAGARAGSTIEVIVGGQNLRSAKQAVVSGTGVTAEVVSSTRQLRNLPGDRRRELRYKIACRHAQLEDRKRPEVPEKLIEEREAYRDEQKAKDKAKNKQPLGEAKPIELPKHPFFDNIDRMQAHEIEHWMTILTMNRSRLQLNTQLAELVTLKITVDPKAAPGRRQIRLLSQSAMTNPVAFHVGRVKELREFEPNDPGAKRKSDPPPAASPPFTANGQIMPGDVDRVRFKARKDQLLVIRTHARSLIPYLADAVPGWFQMVLALRDAEGRELAWNDDFRFHPDPVLSFRVPADGEYDLEIRDSIYRGREDFVYRVEVGEIPFITSCYPLGAPQGSQTTAALTGWNLPQKTLKLDTSPGLALIRHARLFRGPFVTNDVPYAVETLPEINEKEPNNAYGQAQTVQAGHVINGRIDQAGDVDVYRFEGRAGQQFVAEVLARRLNSPLDSLLRLTDVTGETLAWNDDRMDKDGHLHLGTGLLTHHADSYLHATLPTDGPWFVTITDAQDQGSPAHAYRMRISEGRPDFELRVSPSGVNVIPGGRVPIEVFALRNDGFEGPIELSIADPASGFTLSGGIIPAGRERIRLTLTAPLKPAEPIMTPQIVGRAKQDGLSVERLSQPADDTMQAFLWRHLVPADEWLVRVGPAKSKRPQMEIVGPLPVRIPAGGSKEVIVKTDSWVADRNYEYEIEQAVAGLTLSPPRKCEQGLAFTLTAETDKLPAGSADNLIIQAFGKNKPKGARGKGNRWSAGYLPAISFVIE